MSQRFFRLTFHFFRTFLFGVHFSESWVVSCFFKFFCYDYRIPIWLWLFLSTWSLSQSSNFYIIRNYAFGIVDFSLGYWLLIRKWLLLFPVNWGKIYMKSLLFHSSCWWGLEYTDSIFCREWMLIKRDNLGMAINWI